MVGNLHEARSTEAQGLSRRLLRASRLEPQGTAMTFQLCSFNNSSMYILVIEFSFDRSIGEAISRFFGENQIFLKLLYAGCM